MQNIIVRSDDPTVIAGIIDWEGARTIPMWATNPRFMWPIFLPQEEQQHFHRVLGDHIMEKASEWCRAVVEETLPMRLLLERAKYSTANPDAFDWSVPPRHFLSADVVSETCIINV
ncbi:hypothetical protein ARMGADRAFT_1129110 [Armillaria gallica]|uniref:Aminoglycoside phosphotransferase domain-containing protein n=1 Tax=Armillaria gallica TaxID=47427 RepID=A0A2H3CRC8_ARMGA|nr:hypothetical protein ARMGADRAFT_1129110 [Armillaria gallica]